MLASHLAEKGHEVFACARSQIPSQLGIDFSAIDLRSTAEIKGWADQIKSKVDHLDMLVNNAAVLGERRSFSDVTSLVWTDVVETNILGVVNTTRELLPLLGSTRNSTIVNMGSILGRFGRSGWTTYAVSKFAMEGLTQCLSQELAARRVEVLCLHPPRIRTKLRLEAYPNEDFDDSRNMAQILLAFEYLLADQRCSYSGLTLSVSDLPSWRATAVEPT